MKSTQYYDKHAAGLSAFYNSTDSVTVHKSWIEKHLPLQPGFACDIGAGSGRDANWMASLGWDVVAVEPSAKMRELAVFSPSAHPNAHASAHPNVTWLDDSLPHLYKLRGLGHRFDLILLSAVWMHLPAAARECAFRILSELLKPAGVLVITLRHGDDEQENTERGFHAVPAQEVLEFATRRAVALTGRFIAADQTRSHVHWETLVFTMPDDGTGSLPLLRHIIVNDDKSSSYKLGLLRVLTRIAESAPEIVMKRIDDYVDIPLGIVGLYWLTQYKPLLLTYKIAQHPNTRQGYGFAGEDFYKLDAISNCDLRVGARFDAERGAIITGAIKDACKNIAAMPTRYITYPGQSRPVFDSEGAVVRRSRTAITLSKSFLVGFGTFRIPVKLWQTLGQYPCWLEPAVLREWAGLTQGWGIAEYRSVDTRVFDWEEGRRDTSIAAGRVIAVRNAGYSVPCVWSAEKVKNPHIDHCFPWARWLNNDLWNLLPASASVNSRKGDKLPSAQTMSAARARILDWWQHAYLDSPLKEKFLLEADASLPRLVEGDAGLEDIYAALLHQRARLKSDQQLVEWFL
jgi:SAM-dependent methyltransferase